MQRYKAFLTDGRADDGVVVGNDEVENGFELIVDQPLREFRLNVVKLRLHF